MRAADGGFELEPEPPGRRPGRLEQRVGRGGSAYRRRVARRDERSGASVQHGLCRRDGQHEVGLDEIRMDATRSPETDQRVVFRVVHHDPAVELARLRRRKEPLEIALGETAAEPACHEDRLALVRHAAPLELLDRCRDRRLPGVLRRAGQRERRRLDEDRRPSATRRQAFERGPRQREAERVPNRGRDVDDPLGRRRRPKNDVIVPGRHQDDARAGEQRNAAHGSNPINRSARIALQPPAVGYPTRGLAVCAA